MYYYTEEKKEFLRQMDFANELQEILKQDTFKLLLNITSNIFENKKSKHFLFFVQNITTKNTLNIVTERKKFFIYEKLLVLRNIFSNKDTNLKMKFKIYFYNWKRLLFLNPSNSFEKKLLLRKIVKEKISKQDYFSRLMKFSLMNFLNFFRNFSFKEQQNSKEKKFLISENPRNLKNFLSEEENQNEKLFDIRTIASNVNSFSFKNSEKKGFISN